MRKRLFPRHCPAGTVPAVIRAASILRSASADLGHDHSYEIQVVNIPGPPALARIHRVLSNRRLVGNFFDAQQVRDGPDLAGDAHDG